MGGLIALFSRKPRIFPRAGGKAGVARRRFPGEKSSTMAPFESFQSPAAHLLVVGGVANLVLSFLLGWVLAGRRLKSAMEPHRWLLTAHEVALQEGLMLLGLAFAMGFARLPPGSAIAAAWLLIVASAL